MSRVKRPHIVLRCFECQNSFSRKDNLRRHLKEHGFEISASRGGRPRISTCNFSNVDIVYYGCPGCSSYFEKLNQVAEHINVHLIKCDQTVTKSSNKQVATPEYVPIKEHFEAGALENDATTSSRMSYKFRMNLCRPTAHDRYIVEGFDVSEGFYQFQLLVQNMVNIPKILQMESHVYHVLSLSSIFLVIPGHFHNDIKKCIPNDKLMKIVNDLNTRFSIGQLRVKNDVICRLLDIVNDLRTYKVDRDEAVIQLMLLRKQVSKEEYRIIKSFASLIRSLPTESISNTILEQELINRFIAPALNPLFDDPEHGNLFRWIAAMNEEARKSNTIIVNNERPDACISVLDGSSWGVTRGFSEAKCHS
ncbi:hypothetical protein CLU79DRAFT_779087 [Phycomyces nitens]|nr:hypothetical protein CLU79DRAFT_779087 [Phycomyces nitens]